MKFICPSCGKEVMVKGIGRKSLGIPVKNVYDALQTYHNVTDAAKYLGCSRGYIYKVLKENGLKVDFKSIMSNQNHI